MRQKKSSSRLRGSVTQNTLSVRMRAEGQSGVSFLARLGLLAGALILFVFFMMWLWSTGWPQEKIAQAEEGLLHLTQKAQFAIKDVVVEGRHQANKDDIFDALGTEKGAPILAFDTQGAAARLAKLPWVRTAAVERRLPDTIAVILTERMPAARWQHDDHIYVIDTDGHVLPSARPDDFPALPLVVGTGADHEAEDFLTMVKSYPDIQSRMASAVRVGERRWDLHLNSKVIARLPEQDVGNALRRLSGLIDEEKILDRDIVAIDLRMPDRLVIEPVAAHASGAKQPEERP